MKLKNLIKKVINTVQTDQKYRLDYWNSVGSREFLSSKPLPWMNYKVIDYIEHKLVPKPKVFEYGSGSSTRYWIAMGCEVVSIEHDYKFYEEMKIYLDGKCDYRLIEPEPQLTAYDNSPESPDLFGSFDFKAHKFEQYVKSIDSFPEGFFDIVIVDGRARPSCVKRALSKIKRGGLLVLDNSDREYYLKSTAQLLEDWPRKTFRGTVRGLLHKEQTTVFQKP